MAKSPSPSTPAAPRAAATDPSSEVTRVLLDVLTRVNSQVKPPLELSEEAQCAVRNFRSIAAELATSPPFAGPTTAPATRPVDV